MKPRSRSVPMLPTALACIHARRADQALCLPCAGVVLHKIIDARRDGELQGLLRAARAADASKKFAREARKHPSAERRALWWEGVIAANHDQAVWCRSEAKRLRGSAK